MKMHLKAKARHALFPAPVNLLVHYDHKNIPENVRVVITHHNARTQHLTMTLDEAKALRDKLTIIVRNAK